MNSEVKLHNTKNNMYYTSIHILVRPDFKPKRHLIKMDFLIKGDLP